MAKKTFDNDPALQRLEKEQAQIQAKIDERKARLRTQLRKDDTRRKVIAGALALEHTEKNPDDPFARKIVALLDEYARPHERRLFEYLGINAGTGKSLKKDFPK